jgi:uncharacterized protein (TIGR02266 family)
MREKRNHPRFGPLVIKAAFTSGSVRRQGYLTNVSQGGAFLAVSDPPPLGAEVELRAILPWRIGELRARARVAWRSPDGSEGRGRISGVGLAFEEMDSDSRDRLDAYLEKFTELAARIGELEES